MNILPANLLLTYLGVIFVVTFALSACGGGGSSGGTNSAPTASDLSITNGNGGDAISGDNLTGNYSYSDAEGRSSFRWLRDGVAITDATAATYTVMADDSGKSITFEVTPVAATGTTTGNVGTSSGIAARLAIFTTFQPADVVIG